MWGLARTPFVADLKITCFTCAGDAPTIGFGLRIAVKRLPQIFGWAVVSATVGLILKMIENANDKVGAIIAALLGTGWTVLTYFVVPVLAVEGVGPVKAVKQSFDTLRQTVNTIQ